MCACCMIAGQQSLLGEAGQGDPVHCPLHRRKVQGKGVHRHHHCTHGRQHWCWSLQVAGRLAGFWSSRAGCHCCADVFVMELSSLPAGQEAAVVVRPARVSTLTSPRDAGTYCVKLEALNLCQLHSDTCLVSIDIYIYTYIDIN